MNFLITQLRNEEVKIEKWLLYNFAEGIDHAIIFDDQSTDRTIEILKNFPKDKITILPTDGIGEKKRSHSEAMRVCRSFNKGLQYVRKKYPGDHQIAFFDCDEFVTSDKNDQTFVLLNTLHREKNINHFYIRSLDVHYSFQFTKNFASDPATKTRWKDVFGIFILSGKSVIFSNSTSVKEIPEKESMVHHMGLTKNLTFCDKSIARIHHYRSPTRKKAPEYEQDESVFNKLRKFE